MANRERGEVSMEVEGTIYTLRPTINSICAVEDLTAKTFARLSTEAEAGSVSSMRAMLWCYLQECHGEEIKTLEDTGKWMHRAGGIGRIGKKLTEVLLLNASQDKAGKEAGARPRKARSVNGVRSLSKRAASV